MKKEEDTSQNTRMYRSTSRTSDNVDVDVTQTPASAELKIHPVNN